MTRSRLNLARQIASMKVPPERKGNLCWLVRACSANLTLNESPSEKEGKSHRSHRSVTLAGSPSMKVPSKRKGNVSSKDNSDVVNADPQ